MIRLESIPTTSLDGGVNTTPHNFRGVQSGGRGARGGQGGHLEDDVENTEGK